ncbi:MULTISPECIES: hypothetical protein [unclassified Streptomyces]|uniref:hypothetical protein n=1 Tax=unclassified Streptomyces TaxID=2593676 RepID=UPI002E2CA414|nr:hypothetical protein [Streptomyces sp. NBC_01429]
MNGTDLFSYARVHRGGAILLGTAVVALVSAFFGGAHVALPSIGSGGLTSGVPYRQQLPLLSAVFLTAALDGAMSAHDEMGASTMHRFRIAYCTALTLTACVFSFGAEALAIGPEHGVVFVRSLLIWLGLALLSVRLLGQQLSWAIPLTSAFLLIWYPLKWWDWTSTPATDAFSWAAAAIALTVGFAATAATPWRRRGFRRRRKLSAREPAARSNA